MERVDVELLQTLLGNGIVPVVPPLGLDGDGHTYRVNSDAVALEVAKALGAVKLIYITTADGLTVDGALARQLSVDELADALQKGDGGRRTRLPRPATRWPPARRACPGCT